MNKRPYIILAVLGIIFILPGLAAYTLFNYPKWLNAAHTNKGELIQPACLLPQYNKNKKWQLIVWYPNKCDKICRAQIDKISRIRLALGRRMYQVNQVLWLKSAAALPQNIKQILTDHDVNTQFGSSSCLTREPATFISSPDNYLVLKYRFNAPAPDIFHDLKQLLQSNTTKNG